MKRQIIFLLISMENECLGFDTGPVKAECRPGCVFERRLKLWLGEAHLK